MSSYDELFRQIFSDGEFGQINSKLTTNVALEKFGEPINRDPQLDCVSFYYYGLELHFEGDNLVAYRLNCADPLKTLGLSKSLVEAWSILRTLSYEGLREELKRHSIPGQFYSTYDSIYKRHDKISFHVDRSVFCTFRDGCLEYIRWKKSFNVDIFLQVINAQLIESI